MKKVIISFFLFANLGLSSLSGASDTLVGEIDLVSLYEAYNLIAAGTGESPPGLRFRNGQSGNDWWIWMNESQSGDLYFESETPGSNQNRLTLTRSGRLGIGTANPLANLEVLGNTRFSNPSTGWAYMDIISDVSGTDPVIRMMCDSDFWSIHHDDSELNRLEFRFNNTPNLFTFSKSGNFGIGVRHASQKLEVAGTIRAEEVIVETGWADFVFEDDYCLMSLDEVEQFIYHKKRLPGVPSAEDILEKGASLGETQALLLQKIEELTLHLIHKNHQIKDLEARLSSLEEK